MGLRGSSRALPGRSAPDEITGIILLNKKTGVIIIGESFIPTTPHIPQNFLGVPKNVLLDNSHFLSC